MHLFLPGVAVTTLDCHSIRNTAITVPDEKCPFEIDVIMFSANY